MGKIEVPGIILTRRLFSPTNPIWIGLGLKPRLRDDGRSKNRLWLELYSFVWVMISMTKFCLSGVDVNDFIIWRP